MKHKKQQPVIVRDPPFDGHIDFDGELMGYWLPKGVKIADIQPKEKPSGN